METDKPPRTHRSGQIQPHFFGRHCGTLAQASIYGVAAAGWSIRAGPLVRLGRLLYPQLERGRPSERLRGGPD